MTTASLSTLLEGVETLSRDLVARLKDGSIETSRRDIKYVVAAYYNIQEAREQCANRARHAKLDPTELTEWIRSQMVVLEKQIKKALGAVTEIPPVCVWGKSIKGIDAVIAAGLYANLDITRAPNVGKWWRHAGYDPEQKWLGKKGARALVPDKEEFTQEEVIILARQARRDPQWLLRECAGDFSRDKLITELSKRPHNALLKTICWKASDSFVKLSGTPGNSFYGDVYRERKAYEVERNERGENAAAAARELASKNYKGGKKAKAVYEKGRLPDGQVDKRARRWVAKLLLSHWHEVAYMEEHGCDPPKPYVVSVLGHSHWVRASEVW